MGQTARGWVQGKAELPCGEDGNSPERTGLGRDPRGAGNDDESTGLASGRRCARPTYCQCLSVPGCKRDRGVPGCLPLIPAVRNLRRFWGAGVVVVWRGLAGADNSQSLRCSGRWAEDDSALLSSPMSFWAARLGKTWLLAPEASPLSGLASGELRLRPRP